MLNTPVDWMVCCSYLSKRFHVIFMYGLKLSLMAGFVVAMTTLDKVLFVTGNFAYAGSKLIGPVARYFQGRWVGLVGSSVGTGILPGSVHTLVLVSIDKQVSMSENLGNAETYSPCLVIAGEFNNIGILPIKNIAYLCHQSWNISSSFEFSDQHNNGSELLRWSGFDFESKLSAVGTILQEV